MTQKADNTGLLPVYLINGEDELKRQAVLKRLRARVAAMGDIAFNSDTFSGQTAQGADIVTACNTLPFMSDTRLVVVNEADALKKAESEQLVAYLENPSPTTVLALVSSKLAKNTRLYKAVSATNKQAIIDCSSMKRDQLPKTVIALGKQYGVTFSGPAAQKLIELIGENTVALDAEVKKIAIAQGGVGSVDPASVEQLVTRRVEAKPWDLTDALARRDAYACFEVLSRLDSVSEYVLLAQCTTRIRELICAKSLAERGSAQTLADVLHVPSWRVRDHVKHARNYSSQELRCALVSSCETENAMKSGIPPRTAFEQWLLDVVC